MGTEINVTKRIKILDEGVQLTADVSQIDFTGGVTATTVGNNVTVNVPAAGITVGTTPVTSGTDTRVFFQAGGVVQQDANFTFNNTQKRLTLKAVGTAATDIPLSIGNSAGTVNLLQQTGVGSILARSNDTFSYAGLFYRSDGVNGWSLTNSHSGYGQGTGIETVGNNVYFLNTAVRALSVSTQGTGTFKTYGIWNYGSGNGQRLLIGENVFDPQVTLSGTGNLGIGTYTAGARLDVKAQGALSTDIAFRVRNSADSADLFVITGEGLMQLAQGGDTSRIGINTTTTGQRAIAIGSGSSGLRTVCVGFNNVANGQNGVVVGDSNTAASVGSCGIIVGYNNNHVNGGVFGNGNGGGNCFVIGSLNTIGGSGLTNNGVIAIGNRMTETSGDAKMPHTFMFGSYASGTTNKAGLTFRSNNINHLLLGYDIMNASYSSVNGTNWIGVKSGTAPDGAVDAFQVYSADITAGNAAPHFRTENGAIIKVYQETTAVAASTLVGGGGTTLTDTDTFDGYTLKQIVKALRNQGLLA